MVAAGLVGDFSAERVAGYFPDGVDLLIEGL